MSQSVAPRHARNRPRRGVSGALFTGERPCVSNAPDGILTFVRGISDKSEVRMYGLVEILRGRVICSAWFVDGGVGHHGCLRGAVGPGWIVRGARLRRSRGRGLWWD